MGRVRAGATEIGTSVRDQGHGIAVVSGFNRTGGYMEPLIKLEGVTKVFSPTKSKRTRWRASTWRSAAASTCRSPDRRAAASRRCCRSSACSIRRPRAATLLNGRPVGGAAAVGTRARPQSRDRVHLPELQPDWRPERVRERRTAAHLSRHGRAPSGGSASRRRSSASAWRTAPSICPASCRAVSSSASPSPAPWPASR